MKLFSYALLVTISLLLSSNLFAQQQDTTEVSAEKTDEVVVTKNDGTEYIGVILEDNDREILLLTKTIGRMFIPKHEILSIKNISEIDYRDGVYMGNNLFSTRYFLTTNGLPMKKGDSYGMIQLFGPEYHYAVNENFSVGVITTWVAMPVIGSLKYSVSASENLHLGVGTLIGSGTWASSSSFGALGYGSITLGNYKKNITFTAGYVGFNIEGESNSDLLLSVAGMYKFNDKVSFVGDSFIYPGEFSWALVIPGLRFKQRNKGEFQFGMGLLIADGEIIPSPVPMISWFRKI